MASATWLSAIVVAGTHSGAGKTTVTLGLVGALRRRGLVVQPFKVGPDFIDPLHHSRAAGRPSRNLDGWMLEPEVNRRLFARTTAGADVAVIEGVMGLFDGSEATSDRGSTAEMAKLLGLPVVLVIDAAAMARSTAALIRGFVDFDPELAVAGVILNNVGSAAHAGLIREAIAGEVPLLGAIPRMDGLAIPERHLGLHLPDEVRVDHAEQVATLIETSVDLDQLLDRTRTERPPAPPRPPLAEPRARIGVARDEAFCFYYADNLELLREAGAELVEFSPLRDRLPEGLDGLFFGGGYPELHPEALAGNAPMIRAVRAFAGSGGPVYAECGGLMYLAKSLRVGGADHALCGVLPFSTAMGAQLKLAYVEVETMGGLFGAGLRARGHLFHSSGLVGAEPEPRCYRVRTSHGAEGAEGYQVAGVLASYVHLHFASQPGLAAAFVDRCAEYRGLVARTDQ